MIQRRNKVQARNRGTSYLFIGERDSYSPDALHNNNKAKALTTTNQSNEGNVFVGVDSAHIYITWVYELSYTFIEMKMAHNIHIHTNTHTCI